jgi:hypothetical protein
MRGGSARRVMDYNPTSRPHCVQIRGFGVIQQLDIVGQRQWPVYSGRNMIGAVLAKSGRCIMPGRPFCRRPLCEQSERL